MKNLQLLSGGAAKGLVGQLQARFLAQNDCAVQGGFGAVGQVRDRLLAGEPCDVLILTQALIEQLTAQGHVVPGSARALGAVKTGIAVQAGAPVPDTASPEALKAALLAAGGIYHPDPLKATAGIHFMKVLDTLGIAQALAGRLRPFPNGATAMAALAEAANPGPGPGLIGCTQVTEILYTPGVQLAGLLPSEFELATVYTAAVCTRAANGADAAAFIALLAGPEAAPLRAAGGFEG